MTHQPIAKLFLEKIFYKLDLKHSTFSIIPEIQQPVLHSYTSERGVYEDSTYWSPSWVSFSGLVTSNMEDLGKWINAFGTGVLLSKEPHQAMMTPVAMTKDNPQAGFGLGFVIMNSWLAQNPRFGGYSGFFAYLPSKKLGIIVYNTLNPKNSTEANYSHLIVEELVKKLAPDNLFPETKK